MSNFKVGDLVHIPAEAMLYGYGGRMKKLKKPTLGLIVEEYYHELYHYYKVIVGNISWNVHKSDLYFVQQ